MATTVMSVKTDKVIKEEAQKIAKEMGFPLGTLVNAFLRQFIKNKTIYFTSSSSTSMSKMLEKELAKIERDIEKGLNISPRFDDLGKAIAYLKKR